MYMNSNYMLYFLVHLLEFFFKYQTILFFILAVLILHTLLHFFYATQL